MADPVSSAELAPSALAHIHGAAVIYSPVCPACCVEWDAAADVGVADPVPDTPTPVSEICALCHAVATGFATINDDRYCHGDRDLTPTCYERVAMGGRLDMAKEERVTFLGKAPRG